MVNVGLGGIILMNQGLDQHSAKSGKALGSIQNATVMCRKPKPISNIVPANSICTKFEISSGKEFQANDMEYRTDRYDVGEYQLMNISYNDKVVYQKLDTINNHSVYMYCYVNAGDKYWEFGREIGSNNVYACNFYCSDLDYPANGNCNVGWFLYSRKSLTWHYDSNMALECKAYRYK